MKGVGALAMEESETLSEQSACNMVGLIFAVSRNLGQTKIAI